MAKIGPHIDLSRTWTAERREAVRRLWATGATAQQIGNELGVTKHAIIGIAHRIGVPARPSPIPKPQPDRIDISQRRLDALKLPQPGPVIPAIRKLMEV